MTASLVLASWLLLPALYRVAPAVAMGKIIFYHITIAVSPAQGGTVSYLSPNTASGVLPVTSGNTVTFTFTPTTGYYLSQISIDNVALPVPLPVSYTFSNVQASHTIAVNFRPYSCQGFLPVAEIACANNPLPVNNTTPYTLPVASCSVPTPCQATCNAPAYTLWAIPNRYLGCGFACQGTLPANSSPCLMGPWNIPANTSTSWTLTSNCGAKQPACIAGCNTGFTLSGDKSACVPVWTVTITPPATGGTISYRGTPLTTTRSFSFAQGTSPSFTFRPNTGYTVNQVLINGQQVVMQGNTFTLTNISDNYTISATFAPIPPPVTISSGIDNLWHNTPVTFTLTSTGTNPIANTYYSTDGSVPSLVYTAPVTLFIDGTYTIKFYSVDTAGITENVETATNQVKINTRTLPGAITLAAFNGQMGRDSTAPAPTFSPFIRGDVNGDGVVNATDLQILTNYLNGNHSLLSSYDIGDINGDGAITQADIDYLSAYLAGSGPAPHLPFPAPAVIHPYYCAASPCLAVLNNRVIKFIVYYLAPSSTGCAQWAGIAIDPATDMELARYELEAQYGDAATDSSFSIKYSRADDLAANKSGLPETIALFTMTTYFHDNGLGQQVRDEIDTNTAITLLADLVNNVDAGPIPTQASVSLAAQTTGSAVSTSIQPPPGQPGGGNQQFPRCPNGCSGPVNLPFKASPAMNECCDFHDVCYAEGGDLIDKQMCDVRLRVCLSDATSAWQNIAGHIIPIFITKEIAQWFREHFADGAFRWTNERLTCGVIDDLLSNGYGWACREPLIRLPIITKSCQDTDWTCTVHKGVIPPNMPAEDHNYSCIYRTYSPDWPPASLSQGQTAQKSSSFATNTATPQFTGGQCPAISHCGDGNIDPGEECDGTNLGGKTCSTIGLGVPIATGATLRCTPECKFDKLSCTCGNGQRDPGMGEDCEGVDMGGQNCQTLGYQSGNLGCLNCRFDVSTCI